MCVLRGNIRLGEKLLGRIGSNAKAARQPELGQIRLGRFRPKPAIFSCDHSQGHLVTLKGPEKAGCSCPGGWRSHVSAWFSRLSKFPS